MLQMILIILATDLNVSHNYFNSLIKLFSDLYLVKFFLDTSAKPFFSCRLHSRSVLSALLWHSTFIIY